MQPSDKELFEACRGGDESAWRSLVQRYQRLIYAIPRRAGLDDDQSAEVFQDVFTTLLQKLDDIDNPERLHAWLVTTTRRKTWRLISREKSVRTWHLDDESGAGATVGNIIDGSPLADESLILLEEQHRVRTAICALDQRCQKLLTALFYEAEPPSYAEIAVSLGTSEGSIGPTRARCLKKMLNLLRGST